MDRRQLLKGSALLAFTTREAGWHVRAGDPGARARDHDRTARRGATTVSIPAVGATTMVALLLTSWADPWPATGAWSGPSADP